MIVPVFFDPLFERGNTFVREQKSPESSKWSGRIHFTAPLKYITVSVVIITRRSGLGVRVGHIVRRRVPFE